DGVDVTGGKVDGAQAAVARDDQAAAIDHHGVRVEARLHRAAAIFGTPRIEGVGAGEGGEHPGRRVDAPDAGVVRVEDVQIAGRVERKIVGVDAGVERGNAVGGA